MFSQVFECHCVCSLYIYACRDGFKRFFKKIKKLFPFFSSFQRTWVELDFLVHNMKENHKLQLMQQLNTDAFNRKSWRRKKNNNKNKQASNVFHFIYIDKNCFAIKGNIHLEKILKVCLCIDMKALRKCSVSCLLCSHSSSSSSSSAAAENGHVCNLISYFIYVFHLYKRKMMSLTLVFSFSE